MQNQQDLEATNQKTALPVAEKELQVVEIQTDAGPVRLTPSIVRKYLAVGQASNIKDSEITLFMAMCKFNQLNPFLREAWLIKYGDTTQMVVSKEAFVKRAEDSPDLLDWQAGIIVWDKEEKRFYDTSGLIPPSTELIGAWCKVSRKTRPEFRLEVNLDEYLGSNQQMWGIKGKRATMIRKVAIAQALREAFPSRTKRMYIPDEMGLDPDKLPEGAIDVEQAKTETYTSPVQANSIGEAATTDPTPSGDFPRRSRRNKFMGLDKNVFPGGKLETCGAKPEQLSRVRQLVAYGEPANRSKVMSFLKLRVGYDELSYLREDEAAELIASLAAEEFLNDSDARDPSQPDDFDPPESAFQEAQEQIPMSGPAENIPEEGAPDTPEPSVICPYTKEKTFVSFCKGGCRTRQADGFCVVLGEKPPKSGFIGGGAA